MTKLQDDLQEKFPFLSCIKHNDHEFVGIIINQDSSVTSMYDYSACSNDNQKLKLLECGDSWWWESNRQIPIDIFLFKEMQVFRRCLRTFNNKDVEIQFGPVTSIQNIVKKRIKRRTIQLVKKDQ